MVKSKVNKKTGCLLFSNSEITQRMLGGCTIPVRGLVSVCVHVNMCHVYMFSGCMQQRSAEVRTAVDLCSEF